MGCEGRGRRRALSKDVLAEDAEEGSDLDEKADRPDMDGKRLRDKTPGLGGVVDWALLDRLDEDLPMLKGMNGVVRNVGSEENGADRGIFSTPLWLFIAGLEL